MGWREKAKRRATRQVREDRDLPPRMRLGPVDQPAWFTMGLVVLLIGVLGGLLHLVFRSDERIGWILLGLIGVAFWIATRNRKAHRTKGKQELRKEPEAESVDWKP